ncbi:hypothetical protein E6C50_03705 [Flavobacterium supellecticarium]|uniref:Alpha/beta hydrolase n=1 Tax=Flavobacterium supellecticarium TaxID=2565924 RepID=A0A4S4A4S4_9FLAO|nr:hypothetical protein [Flavobacterium supellecticarium]THF53318.1 hypothetical protein E6C50_03705 [Flavobacterium supellecticarium]
MKKSVFIIFTLILFGACTPKKAPVQVITGKDYELKIASPQKAVLVLFPCYPCDIANTKAEAKFLKNIEKQGITTLLLNYNQRLFLSDAEKTEYAKTLNSILNEHNIATNNLYIGGFSGGGNVTMLLSSYLIKSKNAIQPKGIMVVDSPIDLEALYYDSQKDVVKNADPEAVAEGHYLIELLENAFGKPTDHLENYKNASPYLASCKITDNIAYLKDIKTRFYSEPALEWQKQQRNRTYEDLNAYKLEQASKTLKELGSTQTEFIATENRGYRANGDRHPHSWSIVEQGSLVKWMTE